MLGAGARVDLCSFCRKVICIVVESTAETGGWGGDLFMIFDVRTHLKMHSGEKSGIAVDAGDVFMIVINTISLIWMKIHMVKQFSVPFDF